MIEQRVTLRYGAQQIPAIVQAVQGDTGRDVIFELADYEIPTGATANYYIDKPDGNAVYNSAEVISSTEILAHLTEQALAEPGRNNGQVRILSDGEVITSFDFVLEVEVFWGLMRMQSETEVNIFDEALQNAAEDAIQEIFDQTPVVTGMQNSIAPTYSSSSTYAVGDYVMYNAQLYKCNTAITTAEAWTAAHWTQVPIANDMNDLKNLLVQWGAKTINNEPIVFIKDKYIDVRNSTINIENKISASGWKCAVVPCVEGDTFTINGESGEGARLWGFCSSASEDNNLGYASGYTTGNNLIVVAPINAAYLIINTRTTSANSACFKNLPLNTVVLEHEEVNNSFRETSNQNNSYTVITLKPGYIKNDSGIVDINEVIPSSVSLYGVCQCSQNDILVISGKGTTGQARLYAFCDSNGTILLNTSSDTDADDLMVIAPENTSYVVVNTKTDAAKIGVYLRNSDKDVQEEVFDYGMETGGIDSNGYDRTLTYGIRSGFIPVNSGDEIKWYDGTVGYIEVVNYSADKILISQTGWLNHTGYTVTHNGYIRVVYMVNYSTPLDATAITKYGHYLYIARTYTFSEDYRSVKEEIAELYHPPFPTQEKALVTKVMSDRDENTICFAIIADTHNKKGAGPTRDTIHHATVFNRIAEQCGAQFSAHIGDVIHGSQDTLEANMDDLVSYWKEQNKTFLPMLYSVAYHDLSGAGGRTREEGEASAISVSEALGVCQFNTKYLNVDYSSDYTSLCFDLQNRIRVFVLNGDWFTWSTVSFVQSKLENTNLPVVVISHIPLSKYANFGGSVPTNGDRIQDLLNAYNGTIFAHIHGHVHWDNIVVIPDDKFPHYSVLNACPLEDDVEANKGDCLGNPIAYPRTIGDYSEYAFDIFNIHLDTGVVKSFRFGAGLDREYAPNN